MILHDQEGRPVVIRQLEPFQVFSLAVWLTYGVLCVLDFNTYASRALRLYPGIGGEVFSALLVVGSLTGFIGIVKRKTIKGLRLELAGLTMLAFLGLAYIVWTPFSSGRAGTGFAITLGALLVGPSTWLSLRILRYLKSIRKGLDGLPERGVRRDPD